jgi:hypothetical protein
MVMSIRDLAARDRHEVGCLPICQRLAAAFLPFVREYGFNPSGSISLPYIANSLVRHLEGLGNLAIAPAFIAFEQDSCTGQRSCIGFATSHKHFYMRSFVTAEV